ncbi:MAG: hypothetical protein HFF04_03205 [Oscillospiraceae bacterium]|nr:hypothetical protein [Oscillospiraceae bacterium]
MIRIIDTFPQIDALCQGPGFDREAWSRYIDNALPGLRPSLTDRMEKSLATGQVRWETHYLPVLHSAWRDRAGRQRLHRSFLAATAGLEEKVRSAFGQCPEVDIILYFGLCGSAGHATRLHGRPAILLGLEKILELHWEEPRSMLGLVYHELGHIYQDQFGVLDRPAETPQLAFLWQLFAEGVAMYFEQTLTGDPTFYQQDVDGWLSWCDAHFGQIKADFDADLSTMTFSTQRWFGDWVRYEGHGDVGYYLGCRFVRFALERIPFHRLISLDLSDVEKLWEEFA